MANNINWGKIYCIMADKKSWGVNTLWSTRAIPDFSAPVCWDLWRVTTDTTIFTTDTTKINTDITQL